MRVLVTGASGHVGSFVVRRLLRDGHEVIAGVRASSDLWRLDDVVGQVELLPFDLANDRGTTRTRSPNTRPEVVVHAAWSGVARTRAATTRAMSRANVGGTLELVRQAGEAGVRAFVGLGSQAEYGPYDEPLREDMPPATGVAVRRREARTRPS